jgi:hypothetical protein
MARTRMLPVSPTAKSPKKRWPSGTEATSGTVWTRSVPTNWPTQIDGESSSKKTIMSEPAPTEVTRPRARRRTRRERWPGGAGGSTTEEARLDAGAGAEGGDHADANPDWGRQGLTRPLDTAASILGVLPGEGRYVDEPALVGTPFGRDFPTP